MDKTDIVVVGGGFIGLASAIALANGVRRWCCLSGVYLGQPTLYARRGAYASSSAVS